MDCKPEAISERALELTKRTRPLWSVRAYLTWLALACLLPGITGAVILFVHEFRVARAQLEQDTLQTARALLQAVDGQLLRAQAVAQSLSTAGSLSRHDLATFHHRARELLALSAVGANVVLSDESGQQLINTLTNFGDPLPHHGDPELVRRVFATGRPAISDAYTGTVLGRPLVSVDVPVRQGGKVAYDLSVGIQPEQFNAILRAQGLPPTWIAAVFDSTGTIIGRTHLPESFVGQKDTPEFIRSIRETREGSMATTTREGIPVMAVYSRSPVSDWSVGIAIPRQAVEAVLVRALSVLALGVVGLFPIGLGLAWFMGKRIATSVRALSGPAVALGSGKDAPVPTAHIQEAAEVAAAMHQAAELLKERTARLEETNRSLAAREAELTEAHRLAKFGTWYWDLKTGEIKGSESLREVYGRDLPTFPAMKGSVLPEESWERVNAAAQEAARSGIGYDLEFQVFHGSGSTIWVSAKCEVVRDRAGEVVALRGTVLDITERKEAEVALETARQAYRQHLEQQVAERTAALTAANHELERLARRDALTGLQNRLSANERLRAEFLRLKRTGSPYALLLMDIDHFKKINDTYGHETGDHALKQLATTLDENVRATDFVARFGGEEFLILLPDTTVDGAMTSAEKIRKSVAERSFPALRQMTVSVGVSIARADDRNEDDAVRRADAALYRAKDEGRNTVRFAEAAGNSEDWSSP